MQLFVRSDHLDFHITQSAQAAGDRRGFPPQQARVRDEDHIGLEQFLVFGTPFSKAGRTDLLFAFEHEFEVARERAGGEHRLHRLEVHVGLPFIVVRSTGPDTPFPDDRIERAVRPFTGRIDGHDIVVTVYEYGRGCRVGRFFGIDDRIAVGGHHFGPVGSRAKQCIAQPLRAAEHIGGMRTFGADRRDAQQFGELFDEALSVFTDVLLYGVFGGHGVTVWFMCVR